MPTHKQRLLAVKVHTSLTVHKATWIRIMTSSFCDFLEITALNFFLESPTPYIYLENRRFAQGTGPSVPIHTLSQDKTVCTRNQSICLTPHIYLEIRRNQSICLTPHIYLEIRRFAQGNSPSVPVHTLSQDKTVCTMNQSICITPHIYLEIKRRFDLSTSLSDPLHTSISRLDGLLSGPVYLTHSTHLSRDKTLFSQDQSICTTSYIHLKIRRISPSAPLNTSFPRLDGLHKGPVHLSQSTHPSRDYKDQSVRPTQHIYPEIRRFAQGTSPSVPVHSSISRFDGLHLGSVHPPHSIHLSPDLMVCIRHQYIRPTPHTHLEIIRFAQGTSPSVPVHTSILRLDGFFSGPVHLSQSTHPSRD
ncbi:hypothetical protein RRG08_055025 [Elysia crispata]|uniref:Uncharacterized protein n=1 Tax=Elysia crispata TaxID=231223 RepID=A0AAE1CLB1_9GAST|nr:hypothetical protein RRG08_055025 [Elysia crispata]